MQAPAAEGDAAPPAAGDAAKAAPPNGTGTGGTANVHVARHVFLVVHDKNIALRQIYVTAHIFIQYACIHRYIYMYSMPAFIGMYTCIPNTCVHI